MNCRNLVLVVNVRGHVVMKCMRIKSTHLEKFTNLTNLRHFKNCAVGIRSRVVARVVGFKVYSVEKDV